MARPSSQIVLSAEGRRELERLARAPRTQARYAQRAQMVLLAADGLTNKEIAKRLRTRSARVSKWRTRFAAEEADGLCDDFRPGVTPRYDETTERRILAKLDAPPPAGYGRWNEVLLAKALGDVSDDEVWRVLFPYIHFIHVRSKHENALPLIVTHGWPGSIIEQLKIVDPLTNPTAHGASASDASDPVIPSMPAWFRPTLTRLPLVALRRHWVFQPTRSSRTSG